MKTAIARLYNSSFEPTDKQATQLELPLFGQKGFINPAAFFGAVFLIYTSLCCLAAVLFIRYTAIAVLLGGYAYAILIPVLLPLCLITACFMLYGYRNNKTRAYLYSLHNLFFKTGFIATFCTYAFGKIMGSSLITWLYSLFNGTSHGDMRLVLGFGDCAILTCFYFWTVYFGICIALQENRSVLKRVAVYHAVFVSLSGALFWLRYPFP